MPSGEGSGKGGFAGGVTAGGLGHCGERGFDLVGIGPDGDILHGVVVGHLGFGEAVGLGWWGEAVDAGDDAMAVAEAWCVAGTGGGGGVAAGVDTEFFRLGEELGLDEGVELFGRGRVAGLVGEARSYGEEAVAVLKEVGIEGFGEVFGRGFGLGVAAGRGEEDDGDEGASLKFAGWFDLDGRGGWAGHC